MRLRNVLWLLSLAQYAHADRKASRITTAAAPSSAFLRKPDGHETLLHYTIEEEDMEENSHRKALEEPPNKQDEGDEDEQEPPSIPPYTLWSPQEIRDRLLQLAEHYPTLMKLTTAQEEYGLPTAGTVADCPFDNDVDGCKNYIVTLQDFVTHPEGSESSNRLPEVLLSGELHGNEQVGPTAVMETTVLLLKAASCIAYPRIKVKSIPGEWEKELERASSCRKALYMEDGINEYHMHWLARLVSTRRVVIVPTANALGYFQRTREENGIDPNRDFPYDTEASQCMRTIAGRTLNEVFRQHMFQVSLFRLLFCLYEINLRTPKAPPSLDITLSFCF
jgi:hypothetical protein